VEKRRVSAVRLSVSGIVTAFTRITGTNYGNSERLKAIFTVFYNFDIQEDWLKTTKPKSIIPLIKC
jgi:hypothetical protein